MTTQTLTSVRAKPRLRREEDAARHERRPGPENKKVQLSHTSVMVKETIALLDPKKGDLIVDATLGLGGHSEAILKHTGTSVLALDADQEAITFARERLKHYAKRIAIVHANFRDLAQVLDSTDAKPSKFLFDLGWNRTQLSLGRGFSFQSDEPLHMGYSERPASGFTAAEILNTWEEKVLADVFFGYGEERYARPIAKAVVARRKIKPFESTIEFVETIRDAVPGRYRHGRIHPATKCFQALRIAVNDELGSIEKGLAAAWKHLPKDGRIVVITFHSIEDRLVKRTFAALTKKPASPKTSSRGGDGQLLVKKPLVPSRSEITHNPSARSAKMRAIQKI